MEGIAPSDAAIGVPTDDAVLLHPSPSQAGEHLALGKPKPVESWRKFGTEIGVVVIGVLIALGAEQLVESYHWRGVVNDSKVSLRATVKDAYAAILSRQDIQSCVDRRLVDIGTILDRHDRGEPLGIISPMGSPTASFAQTYAFDMAIASQAFSHMSIADQTEFFEPIGAYRVFDEVVKDERNVWQGFRALDRAPSLSPADWSEVRKAHDRASILNSILSVNLRADEKGQWLYPFRGFSRPKDYSLRDIPRVRQLCGSAIVGRDRRS